MNNPNLRGNAQHPARHHRIDAAIKREAEPKIEEEPQVEHATANLPVPSQPAGVVKAEGRAILGSWGRAHAVASWDDVVGQMNKQHAVIDNVGGRTMIACWEPSPLDPKRRINVFHTVGSFKLRHSNRFVTIEVPGRKVGSVDHRSVPLGEYWLGHRDRAQYRGVTFRPKGERVVDECLNIWQGGASSQRSVIGD